jgi:hypothetical protein
MKRMTRSIHILLGLAALCLGGCISSRIATVWKVEPSTPIRYHNIMVAGIPPQTDDSLRTRIERTAVNSLSDLGYYTISSIREFGAYGLKSLNEEATYLTLCDNGVDAVLTFALVAEPYATTLEKGTSIKYTNTYYYNRIWNYRKLQDLQARSNQAGKCKYKWEVILFDLATLQPQCVLQSQSMSEADAIRSIDVTTARFISRMLHEKVIKKQNTPLLKPF